VTNEGSEGSGGVFGGCARLRPLGINGKGSGLINLLLLAPWHLLRHFEQFEPHFLTGVVEKMG
jgi:hypothetical protein